MGGSHARIGRRALLAAAALVAAAAPLLAQEEARPKNRLANAQSPYLRAAASHPVSWFSWGPEPFALARSLDRPILLDIGASWCHWCRVMDEKTYGDPAIAALVNSNFVAIKVDRDERPDVDRYYQDAVLALSGAGGWPLTVFLTPEGRPFFGGSYFPPEDEPGRPGLRGVLERVIETHAEKKDALLDGADELGERLAAWEESLARKGALQESLLHGLAAEIRREFDDEFGGFGETDAPKYLLTAPIEFALAHGFEKGDRKLLDVAFRTLEAAAAGGIHDAVGGGFHRYAAGRDWRVPHFEKMAADNAAILLAALHAFGATEGKNPFFRDLAADVVRFLETTLSDRERGGFRSSQAADVSSGDDGAYFTWTKKEIEDALVSTSEEFRVFAALYRLEHEPRHTPGHPDRNVLARTGSTADVARRLGLAGSHVAAVERAALEKLAARRGSRPAPPVDTTLYLGVNGLAAWAFLEAAPVLGRDDLRDFALKTLERCLAEGAGRNGGLSHAIPAPGSDPVAGFLDDYVSIAMACLAAHEATGDPRWTREGKRLLDVAIARFEDRERGGFFDVEAPPEGAGPEHPPRKRGFGDAPYPGSTPLAALSLIRYAAATGEESYRATARRALESFAGSLSIYGHSAGTFGVALRELLSPPPHVVIVGDPRSEKTEALRRAALATHRPGRVVTLHAPDARPPYPPAADGAPVAYVCAGTSCAPPARDPQALAATLAAFGKRKDPGGKRP